MSKYIENKNKYIQLIKYGGAQSDPPIVDKSIKFTDLYRKYFKDFYNIHIINNIISNKIISRDLYNQLSEFSLWGLYIFYNIVIINKIISRDLYNQFSQFPEFSLRDLHIFDNSKYFEVLINYIFKRIRSVNSVNTIEKYHSKVIIFSNQHQDIFYSNQYIFYLCLLKFLLETIDKSELELGSKHYIQFPEKHLFFPKINNVQINFYIDFFHSILETYIKQSENIYFKEASCYQTIKDTVIYDRLPQTFQTTDYTSDTSNMRYDEEYLDKYQIYTVDNYIEYVKNKYIELMEKYKDSSNMTYEIYMENIRELEIADMYHIFESIYLNYISLYNSTNWNSESTPIKKKWKNVIIKYLNHTHNVLYDNTKESKLDDIDYSKFNQSLYKYNLDIYNIFDRFQVGFGKQVYEMIPSDDHYMVMYLIFKEYIGTDMEYQVTKDNILDINAQILSYINRQELKLSKLEKIKKYYNDIIKYMRRICVYKLLNPNTTPDINAILSQNQLDENNTYDKIQEIEKLNYQKIVAEATDDFIYINISDLTQTKDKIDIDINTTCFGMGRVLEKYGFTLNKYKWKILSMICSGITKKIRWNIKLNYSLIGNYLYTNRLFNIFIIDESDVPNKYPYSIINYNDSCKHIYTIKITKPKPLNLYVIYDNTNKKIFILNNRERIINPPNLTEDYVVTYRELYTISQIYSCKFYRHKIHKWLFLVSPPQYSSRLPPLLKRLNLYDKFVANYQKVHIVKDVGGELIIVDENLQIIGHSASNPYILSENPKIKKELLKRFPFHEQHQPTIPTQPTISIQPTIPTQPDLPTSKHSSLKYVAPNLRNIKI